MMISTSIRAWPRHGRGTFRLLVVAFVLLRLDVTPGLGAGSLRAGAMSGINPSGSNSSVATTSQTSSAATAATYQATTTSVLAQRAQAALAKSTAALQAQLAGQKVGVNNLTLPAVPNGLATGGLVPGIAGIDTPNPATAAVPVPVIVNTGGSASVTLAADTAITLPPAATGNSQITLSPGAVGTLTTGATITPLTPGVATTAPPGSTISLTSGGTITFAAGSAAVPASFSTYAYSSPAGATVPVPASWYGVGGLSQSTYGTSVASPTSTTVTVTQTSQQALLTWQSFNVGANTTLDFDQSAGGGNVGQWVAVNKVAANIAPSRILGSIQAPGQVYVINQNGVLFYGSSQVNVGDLVASSLPINDNLAGYDNSATGQYVAGRGLLNNPDLQFLFSQLDLPAGTLGPTPAFDPQENDPAPGAKGANGGVVAHVDSAGNVSFVAASGQDGDVVVQAGAQLSSVSASQNVGGRIALVGPNVNNSGVISTPDGQTILAAGLQVGFQAHDSNDPTLRGLDTFVGAITDSSLTNPAFTAGTATNTGLIGTLDSSGALVPTPGADVILTGAQVNQNGVIDLSTTVSLNSRVDLLADYGTQAFFNGSRGFNGTSDFYPTLAGAVSFGAGSLTSLTPDLSSTATVVGTQLPTSLLVNVNQLALSSIVNVQGLSIEMGADSVLLANSANVPLNPNQVALDLTGTALTSGVSLNAGQWSSLGGEQIFHDSTGTVTLDQNATIDVSGSQNVAASVADNIVAAQLLSSELENSPLQRGGALEGQTVYVDLQDVGVYNGTAWIGTPLADVSGYINLIQRDVGELTTDGGTVGISAGQSVNLASGSQINVSGGWINYAGANVETTKVVSNGQVLDISQATPNLVYQGIYTGYTTDSAKWGVSATYANPLITGPQYEPGYIQGGSGGALTINAPSMTLAGNLYGNTVAGSQQRNLPSTYNSAASAYANETYLPTILANLSIPVSGSLNLNLAGQTAISSSFVADSPTPADIVFQPSGGALATNPFAGSGHEEIDLSSDLVSADGFGKLSITDSDGNIAIPAGVSLTASPNGSIVFQAANILIDGNVTAPGGNLGFTVYDYSPYATLSSAPPSDPTRGVFTLGSGASLSVAGLVVNDLAAAPLAGTIPLATNGGTLSISAYTADLDAGSSLNVSGGAAVSNAGAVSYGTGGNLSILAGRDPNVTSLVGGNLILDSSLEGYAGGKGGSLTILAPLIQLGGSGSTGVAALDPTNTLLLAPGFFDQVGFATFKLEGLGEVVPHQADATDYLPAVSIAAGATIDPVVQSWTDSFTSNGILLNATTPVLPSQRSPASINLDALGVGLLSGGLVVRGDFVLGSGANLETDPKGSISISASTVDVQGDITAPGGTINIAGAKNSSTLNFSDTTDALVTVDLGSDSVISAAGTVELTPNAYGYTTGSVLPGGSINISGNILAESGSVLNVSGAHGLLDEQTNPSVIFSSLRASPYTLTPQSSGGGEITLAGGQELFTGATLLGASGGAGAAGGSLTLSSGIFISASSTTTTPLDTNLVVVQDGATFVDPTPGQEAIGTIITPSQPLSDVDGNPIYAYFAADPNLFASTPTGTGNGGNAGGFSALTLPGTVEFSGSVSIATDRSIVAGTNGVVQIDPSIPNSSVTLTAPYIQIGQPFQGPLTLVQQEAAHIYTDSNGEAVEIQPTYAAGATLTVNASTLADVGNLSLQDIERLNFNATPAAGDIRGDGTLDVAGAIDLNAAQIYPPTETTFTIAAYDIPGQSGSGLIQISAPGGQLPELPLSAGAMLDVYASTIVQGGVLRAPIGTINLGSGVTGSSPVDALSGQTFDPTENVTMASGSVTSVSAVDPSTGQDLSIPYGTLLNGVSWIDPAGNDITVAGNGANATPDKAIHVSGVNIVDQPGSTVDISGGGDLSAYDFVSGTGGTNDILASTKSFAIIPGYAAAYAPDGGYNVTQNAANAYNTNNTVFDYGYANSQLSVGEQVYLDASNGLPAGVYTLLPARYALLPGAFLVTPKSGTPIATDVAQPDGSSLVAGYLRNGLDGSSSTSPAQFGTFEVDSQAVINSRAEYAAYSANTFLKQSAVAQGNTLTVPLDAGQLVLAATNTMSIQGTVSSQAPDGGLGGQVDIASTSNILISGPNTDLGTDLAALNGSTLVLDSSDLSAFGADSLLIGGYRTATPQGASVTVLTDDLVVDNAGASTVVNGRTVSGLSGPDVILASNDKLTLAAGADIEQSGTGSSAAETLLFGNASVAGSGDGVLVRVSSDASAQILRAGVTANTNGPDLTIGANDTIEGASLTLDSTSVTSLDPSANLIGNGVTIDSGLIVLALDNSHPSSGLVLSGAALGDLQASAQALSLLSYSAINLDGSGTIGSAADASGNYAVQSFTLHADEILGDGGTVTINAENVALDNRAGGVLSAAPGTPVGGTLAVNADTVQLGGGTGVNALTIGGYATVDLSASQGIVLAATAPSSVLDASGNPVSVKGTATLATAGSLEIATPLIVGATGSDETITAASDLTLTPGTGSSGTVTGGLGGSLSLIGQSVVIDDAINLPSGSFSAQATGAGGNVTVGGDIDVSGTSHAFSDLIAYTSGGQVSLASASGSVILNSGSTVTVAANPGGGNAGSVAISAAGGTFTHDGVLSGQAGTGGEGGSFSADVATEDVSSSLSDGVTQANVGNDLTPLETLLDTGGFNQTQSIRVRGGTVNGTTYNDVYLSGNHAGDDARAANYNLSADAGSIMVTGTVDASNVAALDAAGNPILIGGAINLAAGDNVVLASGAELNASGTTFSNAGQGGTVSLLSGAYRIVNGVDVTDYSGYVDVAGGSTIDLRVAANDNSDGSINPTLTAAHAAQGDFSGTLQLAAPRISESDVEVQTIEGNITGASSIAVVANQVYNTASYGDGVGDIGGSGSDITTAILNDGDSFLGTAGQASAGYSAMTARLFGNLSADAQAVANVETGAEIVNPTGSITLTSDWDLSTFRFGPNSAAGVLTVQAQGNLVFQGSLSDGFTDSTNTATLLSENNAVPVNNQSWSYNLVAGADFGAADFNRVLPENETYAPATGLSVPGTAGGSVELGIFASSFSGTLGTTDGQAAEPVDGYYQVIRTGTGNIDIAASGDVLLQNQFATVYTAGVQAPGIADFATPVISQSGLTTLYPAQYSLAGGDISVSAQGDIAHVTLNNNTGVILIDSEKELPNNWLYRRGYVVQSTDPTAGTGTPGDFGLTKNGDVGSTTWWVDFSNFFEGVGALGGGNVTLAAGHDVSDVDAVVPTNTRVPYENADGSLVAAGQTAVELGGGNVAVLAGNDINAGAYYVERGQGTLQAGNSIITNYTRSPSTGALTSSDVIDNSDSWLPTTLFLGQGGFDVTAQDNLLLGPISNPFLLPQGLNNTYWDKSYFSTYASTDTVDVASLTGAITLRTETSPGTGTATPLLQLWLQGIDLKGLTASTATVANYQPWVATTETSVVPFLTLDTILPSSLEATAFSGDINLVGNLTLSPSPTGTISLLAGGSLNGLQPGGTAATSETAWDSSTIDLSDANPAAIPGIDSPYAYENEVGTNSAASKTSGQIHINGVSTPVSLGFGFINSLFAESGSTEGVYGVLQTKEELHASIDQAPLHAGDLVPVRLYASDGDISGLTLFSGKAARVIAGQDVSNVALYIQNDNPGDVSLVAAGRDILPYDGEAPLLVEAKASGNVLDSPQTALDGDIQISGPGTLEVLAGRNLNLGDGANNSDGTGVGVSSIGQQSNPVLPFAGADIVAAAGLDASSGLDAGKLDFTDANHAGFTDLFLNPTTGGVEASRYLPDLGVLLGLPAGADGGAIWAKFNQQTVEEQDVLALDIFYLVLRDAGRDHNNPSGPGAGNYNEGYAAIKALQEGLTGASWPGQGDISLTSREIKTTSGGNISLLVPNGQLDVGLNVSGVQPVDQGILTEDGGNISIFTSGNVNVGTSRIFTLSGGNEIIWSTDGNIDAGASSKTVQSAPPTRVLVDPQSGAVETDLAGLATGGGIGVLETVAGAPPSNVDLIAPNGTVNAGDAGIRASGNLTIAAVKVLNAGNIQVGGKSSGVPTVTAPNTAGLVAGSQAAGSANNAATTTAPTNHSADQNPPAELPSIITVEVLGYGGESSDSSL